MAEELPAWMKEQLDIFLDDHGDDNQLKMCDKRTGTHHVLPLAFDQVIADKVHIQDFIARQIVWRYQDLLVD